MNKKISLGAAIAFMLIVAAAVFSGTMIYAQDLFNQNSKDLEARREMYSKYAEIDRTVRDNYYGAINEIQLMDSVAQGYVKGIGDKYGMYISAEEYKKLTQGKEGEDVGIGAVIVTSPDGYLVVTEVYPESPAQVAGIVAGDIIVKVDDVDLTLENTEQCLAAIQGEQGTKLSLVVRKGTEDIQINDLTRRAVAIPSVYSRIIPETGAGYILIKQFNDNTSDQFNRELRRVIDAGAKCLIFDVRDNKGGTMSAAVRILDKLVPEGVIYSATYRDGTTEIRETSDANEIDLPMVVVVNAGTASAAELFAQDLKDFGKASIVGATTMGKGVMQTLYKLSDGSAVDLTTALFNPTSGVNFDSTGIKPDYEIPLDGDWTNLDETTDSQLKKALEVVLALAKTRETEREAAVMAAKQDEQESRQQEQQGEDNPAVSENSEG